MSSTGSGSTYIYGHCDATYKRNMTKEECYKFVANGRLKNLLSLLQYTLFSPIEAAASIRFLYYLVQFLFEDGFYSRADSMYCSSLSTIRQMKRFRKFLS